jgi:hypothetical protein
LLFCAVVVVVFVIVVVFVVAVVDAALIVIINAIISRKLCLERHGFIRRKTLYSEADFEIMICVSVY